MSTVEPSGLVWWEARVSPPTTSPTGCTISTAGMRRWRRLLVGTRSCSVHLGLPAGRLSGSACCRGTASLKVVDLLGLPVPATLVDLACGRGELRAGSRRPHRRLELRERGEDRTATTVRLTNIGHIRRTGGTRTPMRTGAEIVDLPESDRPDPDRPGRHAVNVLLTRIRKRGGFGVPTMRASRARPAGWLGRGGTL